MSTITVNRVTKAYGNFKALDDVSIEFADGEFFGLLGPSGSGKTTLLRAIAGFITPDAGSILFDGQAMDDVPVHRRGIGMVFQSYALFPHLTVADNVGFGLDVRGAAKAGIAARVDEMLGLVRLPGLGARRPRELSGGQQQRVALARALITDPKVLLLDEPLGALDRRLRQDMQVELRDIQRKTGVTAIFVTHDQEEALTLADRIAIINEGRIVQAGPPQQIYERPATVFAARFLGDANVLRGRADASSLTLPNGVRIASDGANGGTAIVRPEKMTVATAPVPPNWNSLSGTVRQAVYSGASVTYRVNVAGLDEPLTVFVQNQTGKLHESGEAIALAWEPSHTIPVTA